jgi:ATP-dependent DNA helicase RecQ
MEDQKQSLEEKDIPVIALNSNLTPTTKQMLMSNIIDGENKIIYMSPEYIIKNGEFVIDLWDQGRLSFVAIDEAHCVSSWGNDFRPDYQALSCLKSWIPVPIMALTATATQKVRDDIAESLILDDYYEFTSSFDRPNLYIEGRIKTDSIKDDLKEFIKDYSDQFCIIYARTRDATTQIATILQKENVNAKAYHAGLSPKLRTEIQDEFANGDINWIVATVAFGMGIDQDVKLVLHYGSPGDLESYYQEIGRAGRDGKPAKCILFHGKGDMVINRILLKDIKDVQHKKHREKQILSMEKFLRTEQCRRRVLLDYFGEIYEADTCKNCDNCTKTKRISEDLDHDLQWPIFMFKTFMMYTEINGGIGKLLKVIMGNKVAAIKDHHNSVFFGLGKRYDINFWKMIIEICIHNEYLIEETIPSGFGTIIKVTDKLKQWYNNIKPIIKEKKMKNFDYDNYVEIAMHLQEEHSVPSTCIEIGKYIRKRTMTTMEYAIHDEDIYVV